MEENLRQLVTDTYDFHRPKRGDILKGVLLSVEEDRALVDIEETKREGFVPKKDLELLGEEIVGQLAVGDEVAVYVMKPEDSEGNLLVSINLARQEADWERAKELLDSGEVWEGEVEDYNKGGLLVSFGQLRGFVPQSHVMELPRGLGQEEKRERKAQEVGKKLPLKVIEVNRRRRRLVLSNRAAVRAWRRKQRERLLEELCEGDVVHGTVRNLCDFGAFVDLGGADGLIHISELAWYRVGHPSEVLEEGQEVDVYVLRLDYERKRIGLSLKRLQPDPWSLVSVKYAPDDLVEGVVTNIVDFGAFIRLEEGVEGLVHTSEMPNGMSPEEAVSTGQEVLVRVLRVQPDRRRMGLSLRQVSSQGQEEAETQSSEQTSAESAGQDEEDEMEKEPDVDSVMSDDKSTKESE
ncbi:MAG: S1 RNA-binding domain-containing protein [Chloroflexota bacterium]|nr:S1 RNA-binding domain-containing protein [Chloroflexota bacterium]